MSSLTIVPVHSRRQQRQFLQLPWQLYRHDPNWIPPLRMMQKELVGFKHHPFYDHAEFQTFLAMQDGQAVGRVAAIVNHAHNRRYEEKRGFFGFFESIENQQVASELLDAASRWLRERGMTCVRGPMNPSMNYELGTLVDGFDSPPTFLMTYNPPYYGPLIENSGFQKVQDLYAFWGHVDMLKTLDEKVVFISEEARRRFEIQLRRIDTSKFQEEVRMFLRIYNESLGGTWGFTPMSEGEIRHMGKSLRFLIVPEMTSVAEVDGRPVAAVFGLLDYNERIKQIDGRLFPFGFLRLLWKRNELRRIRVISTNVLPEYQRWGIGLVAMSRLLPDAIAWGIQEAEFSWVLESNHLSYGTLKRGGAKLTKTYRIYDKDFAIA